MTDDTTPPPVCALRVITRRPQDYLLVDTLTRDVWVGARGEEGLQLADWRRFDGRVSWVEVQE